MHSNSGDSDVLSLTSNLLESFSKIFLAEVYNKISKTINKFDKQLLLISLKCISL
jgi:hypothetical protein